MSGASSQHSWLFSLGCPEACTRPLVHGTGYQAHLLRGPRCLGVGIGLLVGGAGAQGLLWLVPAHCCLSLVPGLVPTHRWAEPGPRVSGCRALGVLELVCWLTGAPAHWWAELGPRVSGCRSPEFPGLVPDHWCIGPGPRPSGGQGHVPSWLWAQEVLR